MSKKEKNGEKEIIEQEVIKSRNKSEINSDYESNALEDERMAQGTKPFLRQL